MICLDFLFLRGNSLEQNAWVEFPETTWAEDASSRCFDLRLFRLRRDSRGAQHGKSEMVSSKSNAKVWKFKLTYYRNSLGQSPAGVFC